MCQSSDEGDGVDIFYPTLFFASSLAEDVFYFTGGGFKGVVLWTQDLVINQENLRNLPGEV